MASAAPERSGDDHDTKGDGTAGGAYEAGFRQGYRDGHADGFAAGLAAAGRTTPTQPRTAERKAPLATDHDLPPLQQRGQDVGATASGGQKLLLRVGEAAYRLHISKRQMERLILRGEQHDGIASLKIGGLRRVPLWALEEYIRRLAGVSECDSAAMCEEAGSAKGVGGSTRPAGRGRRSGTART